MKPLHFFHSTVLSLLLLGLAAVGGPSLRAEAAKKDQRGNAPALNRSEDRPQPAHRKTAKEKEYSALVRKIREADDEFEKNWRSAKPSERQKLRAERLEKLQPTLVRLNQLALEIRKARKDLNGDSAPKPVPVTGPLQQSEEIKGKTESELRQMGLAVGALHQKQANDAADAQTATAPGK